MSLNGYLSRLPSPVASKMERVLDMIKDAKRPVVYAGGGCLDAAPGKVHRVHRHPHHQHPHGFGMLPCLRRALPRHARNARSRVRQLRRRLGGSALAFGVRFDDRVTGKLEAFAARASIVHIDIDPAEIGKNKEAHCPVFSNIKPALRTLQLDHRADKPELDFSEWRADIAKQRAKFPFAYRDGRLHRPAARRGAPVQDDRRQGYHLHRRRAASDVGGAALQV